MDNLKTKRFVFVEELPRAEGFNEPLVKQWTSGATMQPRLKNPNLHPSAWRREVVDHRFSDAFDTLTLKEND